MKPFYQLCTSIVIRKRKRREKKTFCLYQQTDNLVGRRKKWRLTQNDCTMLPNNNSIFALCYAKQHLSMLIVVLSLPLSSLEYLIKIALCKNKCDELLGILICNFFVVCICSRLVSRIRMVGYMMNAQALRLGG